MTVCSACIILPTIHSKLRQDSTSTSCPDKEGSTFSFDEGVPRSIYIAKTEVVLNPVLAYPDFCKDFVFETDASIKGLGAVLSQKQNDEKVASFRICQ